MRRPFAVISTMRPAGLRWALPVICAVVLALIPARAPALEMPDVSIEAVVETNGMLHIEETRSFAFDDDANGVFWTVPSGRNEQGRPSWVDIPSVEVWSVSEGERRALKRAGSAEKGDEGVFTLSQEDDVVTVRLFSPQEAGSEATFLLSYDLAGAVMVWADTAELYWQFVGPDWEAASENVGLSIEFAAEGEDDGESMVRAWAHGPLEGTVSVESGAPRIIATAPRVLEGQYAEVRALFPVAWVGGLAPVGDSAETERTGQVLAEERRWAEEATARRERIRAVAEQGTVAALALPALLLVAVAVYRFTRCRVPEPLFQQEYLQELPSNDHPAVLAAFSQGGRAGERSFSVTLMKLAGEGAVGPVAESDGLEGPYRLRLLDPRRLEGEGIDAAALRVLFGEAETEASFEELGTNARDDPAESRSRMGSFRYAVELELAGRGLSRSTVGFKMTVTAVSVLLFIALFALTLYLSDAYPAGVPLASIAAGAACLVAALLLAHSSRIVTQEGSDLTARCAAFCRWVEYRAAVGEPFDVSSDEERRILVAAAALGVGGDVLRALASSSEPDTVGGAAHAEDWLPHPLIWWVFPHYGNAESPLEHARSAYGGAVAVAADGGASTSGMGGGFSAGGGGGVGGGGGGSF